MTEKKQSRALLAITAAAVSLPGLLPKVVEGSTPIENPTFSYRYSRYAEDPMAAGNLLAGDPDRYEIDTHQLRFQTAIGDHMEISFDLIRESMSGASPWFVAYQDRLDDEGNPVLDGEGRVLRDPVQVMSSATIVEDRTAFDLGLSRYFTRSRNTTTIGFSTENDYDAYSFSTAQMFAFNNNNTELEFTLRASRDQLAPTHTEIFTPSVESANKYNVGGSISLAQVMTRSSIISTALGYNVYNGFLSDPYKRALVGDNIVPDSRPDIREHISWHNRYRKFFSGVNAALHLDYRYFADSWHVDSHTVLLGWHQNFGQHVRIAPEVRWYAQSEAAFYRNYYDHERNDGFYSSDYRLSAFAALSMKVNVIFTFESATINIAYESYESTDKSGDATGQRANPGLVSFSHIGAGFAYRF